MHTESPRREPLETPGRNSTYGDGDTPEIDLPSSDNATPQIPLEFPDRTRQAGYR